MRYPAVAVVMVLLLAGCEPPPKAQPPGVAPVAAPAQVAPSAPPPGVVDAKDAKRVWTQADVEQFLREDLDLKTVSLKPTGNNGYQGTGEMAEGTVCTIVVKQVIGGIQADWTTATGHGRTTFGNPVP